MHHRLARYHWLLISDFLTDFGAGEVGASVTLKLIIFVLVSCILFNDEATRVWSRATQILSLLWQLVIALVGRVSILTTQAHLSSLLFLNYALKLSLCELH